MQHGLHLGLVVLLTGLSGLLDARGFYYASRAWPQGLLDWRAGSAAILCFVGGLSCYIVAVRFLQGLGVQSVAIQTAIWFIVTAIGIGVLDGSITHWTRAQQLVALAVTCGVGWLAATTAAPKF